MAVLAKPTNQSHRERGARMPRIRQSPPRGPDRTSPGTFELRSQILPAKCVVRLPLRQMIHRGGGRPGTCYKNPKNSRPYEHAETFPRKIKWLTRRLNNEHFNQTASIKGKFRPAPKTSPDLSTGSVDLFDLVPAPIPLQGNPGNHRLAT